ncbi:bifunctional phosphoribosylaminoimidazolecarboxamide formyltransferase/IMP cyclohydrolase [Candidatus Omnitrophus magneticus]|uniref:Bifunctional purine biosynthesis protein PurH n=1 Tax=Candidatus Omnitrophus magneticus TaxID=1609969 RepID=A0A0F0CRR5_9BACT|nr:bifunctional phosphoribosylaminoimidazolecarboxamide formyltransferase/IMP cyclohydrolase [Candidatus Omnitrophus magneticus]
MKIKRVLISVSDKSGLKELVYVLNKIGVEIISTGGTKNYIQSLGVNVIDISSYTGFSEILDGRVKTLHPKIHAGLLAVRDNEKHAEIMKEKNIPYIDMVIVNLYPFSEVIRKAGVTFDEAIENIDIGGPSMLRSAAKNFQSVAVVSSPNQYEKVALELEALQGELSLSTRKSLAVDVFKKTSEYDNLIFKYLLNEQGEEDKNNDARLFPENYSVEFLKLFDLRYGENPHQKGAFYKDIFSNSSGIVNAVKLQGKELSFNNILDLDSAWKVSLEFEKPAAVIVKHNNPCGVAMNDTLETAFIDALDADRESSFGGIMAFNRAITASMAELILKEGGFIECVLAPDYDSGALEFFATKKNIRVLKMPFIGINQSKEFDLKKVIGGALLQELDMKNISANDLKIVTKIKPSASDIDSLLFAWKVVKHVKSNAIVLANGSKTIGIGAGQMSRVNSVKIAIQRAGNKTKGAFLASDAFFPMPDSITEAVNAGVRAIIQPGGSIKDNEVIEECDKHDIAMVFTCARHFRH